MRSYGDVVDVRCSLVAGQEAPGQFLWRGSLWKVREVIAHWIETGAWWEQAGVAALFGTDTEGAGPAGAGASGHGGAPTALAGPDLLAEREYWRVEASRGRLVDAGGVFDLAFDWSDGQWRLARCVD